MGGPLRFKDLQEQMPTASDRILSERLKELETAGVVQRKVYDEWPVRIEYELTQKGRDLESVVEAIQRWAEKYV
ncbi:MAG: transcriptional regulator [Clostridia bacterium]|nr:MAG: transcriptional regulator [Clostridia bacterium]